MNPGKVSVIVPMYNRESLLSYTIESVLNQTYPGWELILIDDGSTDNSVEIAKKYALKDNRIVFLKRERIPKGASACRNIGLKAARGEYIIFLDSDDLLAPYCIERRLQYFSGNQGLDFLVFPMLLFKEKPDDLRILQNVPTGEEALDRFLKRENVWLMSSPIWKKKSLEQIGGFNESYLSFQDWELNTRALISGLKFKFLKDAVPDNFYRQHTGNTISQKRYFPEHNASNAEMIINTFLLLKENKKLNESRRRALGGFFTDVLLRYRFAEKPRGYLNIIKDYLNKAKKAGFFTQVETKKNQIYFQLQTFKIAYLSGFYRKVIDKIYKNILLKYFYPFHRSNQLKHKYNGSLA